MRGMALAEQRNWIERVQFWLYRDDGVSYALFLQQVVVQLTRSIFEIGSIAGITMRRDGTILMYLHWPSMEKLDVPVCAEIVKHEILHVIYGHTSSRGEQLRERYGKDITGIAIDLVVNQNINTDLLVKAGWKPVTIHQFGLPAGMTTEWYCEQLLQKALGNTSGKGIPVDLPESLKKRLKGGSGSKVLGPGGQEQDEAIVPDGPFETFDFDDGENETGGMESSVRDVHLEKVLTSIREEMKGRKDIGSSGRGWESGEALEWIEQVRRPAQIAWHSLLRTMESKHMRVLRELTKSRPSRRDPAHFGRIRRNGLYLWGVTDTSGSMQPAQLSLIDPEYRAITSRGGVIDVWHVDARIAKVERYNPRVGIRGFAGRGGTDFSPVFMELPKIAPRERPDFIVYLTDGYGGLEAYERDVNARRGDGYYGSYCSERRIECPDGVDVLWLIPEGCVKKDEFIKTIGKFGMVSILPKA